MKIKEYYDVTVIGAGPAGLCAAIQAARAGVSTCLVEKNGIAGGTITAGGIPCPGIFHAWGRQVISGIGWELVRRTREESGEPLPDFSTTNLNEHWRHQISIDPVLFAALCDEEFEKAGVIVKYHTMVGRATLADDGIELELCGKDGLLPHNLSPQERGFRSYSKLSGATGQETTLSGSTLSLLPYICFRDCGELR